MELPTLERSRFYMGEAWHERNSKRGMAGSLPQSVLFCSGHTAHVRQTARLFLSAAVFVLAIEKSGQPHGLSLSVSRAKADSVLIACKSRIAEKCPRLRPHGQQ